MKPSIIFRIQRFIRFLLQGVGKKEREHYLFTIPGEWTDFTDFGDYWVYRMLADHGWTPNYMGYIYKGQIYQCRRLVDHGDHQYHVRFYQDGRVTGHFEVAPEYDTSDHLSGVDLRTMTKEEADQLKSALDAHTKE